jgi:nucleoside-diphosphate-sugar epimerase
VRVAVTGATGRVGSKVIALLIERGHSVVAIDRRAVPDGEAHERSSWLVVDVTDYANLLAAFDGCDAVVHLAAVPGPAHAPEWAVHQNNVVASYNALHAAASLGISRICQASSINAIGAAYSRAPRFDYFPIDEAHPTYNEDPYSLSKWICEQQAASIARRHESIFIASLRLHFCAVDRGGALESRRARPDISTRDLWGYTTLASAAGACLLSIESDRTGDEVFLIVAPDHAGDGAASDLAATYYPQVPVRGMARPGDGFFDCSKAARLLGWRHEEW